jgi:hypothetical protein
VSDADDLDGLVFDDDFVRAGRREESADERLERLTRIARDNAAAGATPWRTAPTPLAPPPRPARRGRRLAVATTTALVVLGGYLFLDLRPGADEAVPARSAGDGTALAEIGPGSGADPPEPVEMPTRLAPLPADPGGEGGYRFLQTQQDGTGGPVGYDPCRPVAYVVRRAGEPPGGDALLQEAVAVISAATGLVFERGPDTDEPLADGRELVQPDRYGYGLAPVLVAWTDERESPDLAGYIAGVAGSATFGWQEPGTTRLVTGELRLDTDYAAQALARPGGAAELRSTILHELGHLVGLNHVADRDQIMFSEGGDNRLDLGPGDRRGLRLLGAGRCFTDWAEVAAAAR